MGESEKCDREMLPGEAKKIIKAVIVLNYNDWVVIKKDNITATLRITRDGIIEGKTERTINLKV